MMEIVSMHLRFIWFKYKINTSSGHARACNLLGINMVDTSYPYYRLVQNKLMFVTF